MPEIFRTELNHGFISVWQVDEDLEFFKSYIAENEYSKLLSSFKNKNRLRQKLVPHYLIKKFNNNLTLDNFDLIPKISNGFISISHCKNFLAVSYDDSKPVGIDVEYYGERILKIGHKYLNEHEKTFCDGDSLKSLVVWSAKEALFKKFGGDTVFFKENISIEEFEKKDNLILSSIVKMNGSEYKTDLMCKFYDEFLLVYTI